MSQDTWNAVDDYLTDTLVRPDPVLDAALRESDGGRASRDQRLAPAGQVPEPAGARPGRAQHPRGRARWAATAPSGSPARCRRAADASSRSRWTRSTPRSRAPTSPAPGSRTSRRCAWAAPSTRCPSSSAKAPAPSTSSSSTPTSPRTPSTSSGRSGSRGAGTVIVVDNVVRNGAVADAGSADPAVLGVRRLNLMMAGEPRVSATAIQTVGSKGYDGFARRARGVLMAKVFIAGAGYVGTVAAATARARGSHGRHRAAHAGRRAALACHGRPSPRVLSGGAARGGRASCTAFPPTPSPRRPTATPMSRGCRASSRPPRTAPPGD